MYSPSRETENCGVGLVASLKKSPSRRVVSDADDMLRRMSHRGGCGCDPASGDGAGILLGMPDSFMRAQALKSFGTELPKEGDYAVGNVFFPKGDAATLKDRKDIVEGIVKRCGLAVVGWRAVPVNNTMLGDDPRNSEPRTEQLFVTKGEARKGKSLMSTRNFDRELMR